MNKRTSPWWISQRLFDRIGDRVQRYDERKTLEDAEKARVREANRCPWVTPASHDRCSRKAGHKGLCEIRFIAGGIQSYYGINYPNWRKQSL